ncbi:ABC transporter permease [Ruminiclostridium josui]|uniref:ABC transporter permease n=1 Tax=Ruminiclostridium josui TaxID=1499 RepID=UPI0004B3C0DC|nr:ABC transporter permease subunit [Ruminiclostridium josui]
MDRLKNLISASFLTIVLFVVWHIAIVTGAIDNGILPAPLDVLKRILINIQQPDFWQKTLFLTVKRGLKGFTISATVGIFIGVSLATYLKFAKEYIMPLLHLFEKLNPLALFPLFMLFFGIGDESKAAIVFWVVVWQIAFHTLAGIENVDKEIIKGAKAMGTNRVVLLLKVILPASLPELYIGFKLGVQMSFLFVVSVEMISSSNLFPGLGGFIMESKKAYNLPNIYSGIIITAIIGIVLTKILDLIGEKLFDWKQKASLIN